MSIRAPGLPTPLGDTTDVGLLNAPVIGAVLLLYLLWIWPVLYIAKAIGWAPAVPLTIVPVVAMLLAAARGLWGIRDRWGMPQVLAVLLFLWVTALVLLSGDAREQFPAVYHSFLMGHLAYGGGFLVAGLTLRAVTEPAHRRVRLLLRLAVGTYALAIVAACLANPLSDTVPWYLAGIWKPDDASGLFDYLFVADHFALTALALIAFESSFLRQLLTTGGAASCLFWASSRSALAIFIVVAAVMLAQSWRRQSRRVRVLAVALGLCLAVVASIRLAPAVAELLAAPELERYVVSDFREDASFSERAGYLGTGLRRLQGDWLLGRFMGEALDAEVGTYIHNWLSFWSAYGVGPFLLFVALFCGALRRVSRGATSEGRNPTVTALFGMSWFIGCSIVFSRSYGSHQVWLILSGVPSAVIVEAAVRRQTRRQLLPVTTR